MSCKAIEWEYAPSGYVWVIKFNYDVIEPLYSVTISNHINMRDKRCLKLDIPDHTNYDVLCNYFIIL